MNEMSREYRGECDSFENCKKLSKACVIHGIIKLKQFTMFNKPFSRCFSSQFAVAAGMEVAIEVFYTSHFPSQTLDGKKKQKHLQKSLLPHPINVQIRSTNSGWLSSKTRQNYLLRLYKS